jgi:hypothetical protein
VVLAVESCLSSLRGLYAGMRADQTSAVIVTTSSRKDRLEGYLGVGDIDLTDEDVKAIDKAGKKGQQSIARREMAVKVLKWATVAGLAGYIGVKTFM